MQIIVQKIKETRGWLREYLVYLLGLAIGSLLGQTIYLRSNRSFLLLKRAEEATLANRNKLEKFLNRLRFLFLLWIDVSFFNCNRHHNSWKLRFLYTIHLTWSHSFQLAYTHSGVLIWIRWCQAFRMDAYLLFRKEIESHKWKIRGKTLSGLTVVWTSSILTFTIEIFEEKWNTGLLWILCGWNLL